MKTPPSTRRSRQARTLRIFRRIHRLIGISLFAFFFVVAVTGLLLGWKKHSGGLILPESHQGSSENLSDWLPFDVLHEKACRALHEEVSPDLSLELDRIDARPDKGMVKFVFVEGFWGIQLDGATGELLHVERRRSDFIEKLHDGSILDYWLGTSDGQIKLAYTTIMGTTLLAFTVTGFWLWVGPKRMRSESRERARSV